MSSRWSIVIDVLGEDAAALLMAEMGSEQVYIPIPPASRKKVRSDPFLWQKVIELIGCDLSAKLVAKFGGKLIYVPKGHSLLIKAKYKAIIDGYKGGNVTDYALTVGLSSRQVYEIFLRHGVTLPGEVTKPKQPRILVNYEGETVSQYAAKLGIPKGRARTIMRKHGVTRTPDRQKQEAAAKRLKLAKLWQGECPAEFAKLHGISREHAGRVIIEAKNLPKGIVNGRPRIRAANRGNTGPLTGRNKRRPLNKESG